MHRPDSLENNGVSGNVCSLGQSESDSESELAAARRANRLGVSAETLARFWAKVEPTSHCWLWTANKVRGYGQFVLPYVNRRQPHVYAHRFAYELIHGPIVSPDVKACHRCDTPLCVRPSHLFLGSQADNLSDARAKGRLVDGAHMRKLSAADIWAICAAYRPRVNGKALAERYGVHLITILRVVRNGRQRRLQSDAAPFQHPSRALHVAHGAADDR